MLPLTIFLGITINMFFAYVAAGYVAMFMPSASILLTICLIVFALLVVLFIVIMIYPEAVCFIVYRYSWKEIRRIYRLSKKMKENESSTSKKLR